MFIATRFYPRASIFLFGALCLLLLRNPALAMWMGVSEAELIAQSPLIVVGTLVEQVQTTLGQDQTELTVGVLQVEQVLKSVAGGSAANPAFVLLALPRARGMVSSANIHYSVGQQGLWFLVLAPGTDSGLFDANHPQRFVPMPKAQPVIERVQKALAE